MKPLLCAKLLSVLEMVNLSELSGIQAQENPHCCSILNGLLKPKSGTIIINGIDITSDGVVMRDIRRRVGLVFQYPEYQLFEETVAKDVAYGPGNLGLPAVEIDERVREAITLVGLNYEEVKDVSPFELSGGQKRRVAIAGVIAMKPEVLILDEPTAGLNPRAHHEILDMVQEIHKKEGNTIIFVSHNMNDIVRMSDCVIVMNEGTVVMDGTPGKVLPGKGIERNGPGFARRNGNRIATQGGRNEYRRRLFHR